MVTQKMLRRMAEAAAAKKAAEVEYEAAKRVVAVGLRDGVVEPGPLAVREVTSVRQNIRMDDVRSVLGQPAADLLAVSVKKTVVTYLTVVPATAQTEQVSDGGDGKEEAGEGPG